MKKFVFACFSLWTIGVFGVSSYVELDAIFSQIDWKIEKVSSLLESMQMEKHDKGMSDHYIQMILEKDVLCSSLEDIFLRDIIQNQLRAEDESWQKIMNLMQIGIQDIEKIRQEGNQSALKELRSTMRELKRTMKPERIYRKYSRERN